MLTDCGRVLLIFSETGDASILEQLPALIRNAELSLAPEKEDIHSSYAELREKFAGALMQRGASVLGRGDDAVTVALPKGGYAIRIGLHPEAYGAFIEIARKMNNPHFPRVFYHGEATRLSVTIMECLGSSRKMQRAFWQMVNDAVSYAHAIADQRPFHHECLINTPLALMEASCTLGKKALALHYALDFSCDNILVRDDKYPVPVFIDIFSPWGQ